MAGCSALAHEESLQVTVFNPPTQNVNLFPSLNTNGGGFSLDDLLDEDCDVGTQSNTPNNWFLLLKNKIVNTDKLIQRYQGKSRKVKDLLTSLAGLKKELKLQHQGNDKKQMIIDELRNELEITKNIEEEQKVYIEQLRAKVDEFDLRMKNYGELAPLVETMKKEKKDLWNERDRLRKENKRLKQKLRRYYSEVPTKCERKKADDLKSVILTKKKEELITELQEELDKLGSAIAKDDTWSHDEGEGHNEIHSPWSIDNEPMMLCDSEGGVSTGRKRNISESSDFSCEIPSKVLVTDNGVWSMPVLDVSDQCNTGLHDNSFHSNHDDSDAEYESLIADIGLFFGHTPLPEPISPLPLSPPVSPLPTFDFCILSPLSPLPPTPSSLREVETIPFSSPKKTEPATCHKTPPISLCTVPYNVTPPTTPPTSHLMPDSKETSTDVATPTLDMNCQENMTTSISNDFNDQPTELSPVILPTELDMTTPTNDLTEQTITSPNVLHVESLLATPTPDNTVTTPISNNSEQPPFAEPFAESCLVIDSDDLVIDSVLATPTDVTPIGSSEIEYEDGQIVDEVLAVGYSATPSDDTPTTDNTTTKEVVLTDGATGQWMNEATPSSSRSTSPLFGSLDGDFPTVQITSQAPPTQPVCGNTSQAQQSLPKSLQCPMPLPHWLAEVLLRLQDDNIVKSSDKQGKKNKFKIPNAKRSKGQSATDYVFKCISATIANKMPVSQCIDNLSKTFNVNVSLSMCFGITKVISTKYFPPFEGIMKLCWSVCSAVVGGTVDTLSTLYVPPLPLEESIMLSILLNVVQLRNDMPTLLFDVQQKMRECILSEEIDFHSRCVYCRLYSCICRAMSNIDQVQFIVCDILLQSMAVNIMPLVVAIVSMWPKAFSRSSSGPPLIVNRCLNTKGLEYQPISFTIETVMSVLAQRHTDQSQAHKGPFGNSRTLCKWEIVPTKIVQSLVVSFVDILCLSNFIKLETPPPGSAHGSLRPHPSKHAFAIVTALRLLAASQGWTWTNDTLIREHLWPLLQKWNKNSSNVRQETIVCVIRLLGFIGQTGLVVDSQSNSIQQLVKVFVVILQKATADGSKVPLAVQLAAADSLLQLSSSRSSQQITTTMMLWIKHLMKNKETTDFAIEYSNITIGQTGHQYNRQKITN